MPNMESLKTDGHYTLARKIFSKIKNWVENCGFLTGITKTQVTDALGYTPLYDSDAYIDYPDSQSGYDVNKLRFYYYDSDNPDTVHIVTGTEIPEATTVKNGLMAAQDKVDLAGKVSKSGDTMTGTLENSGSFRATSNFHRDTNSYGLNKTSSNSITSTAYVGGYLVRDKNDASLSYIYTVMGTTGTVSTRISTYNKKTDGTSVSSTFGLNCQKDGNPSFYGGTGVAGALRDFLSFDGYQTGITFKAGTKTFSVSSASKSIAIFTNAQINTLLGVTGSSNGNTVVFAVNGDYSAKNYYYTSPVYENGTWYVRNHNDTNFATGTYRVNYLVIRFA